MKICGLQKVSTIDYPGEVSCIIFLFGCNFRCGFCYNPDLVIGNSDGGFSEESVLNFLKSRIGKLDAVCITGGEPLMSLDFSFVRKIKEMGFKVKIDTNGSFPNRLKEMVDLRLVDYIAMDVKGSKENYSKIIGVGVDFDKIEKSMRIVNEFDGEFRTTIVDMFHSKDNLVEMAKWMNEICVGKPKRIFLQGFKSGQEMIDSSFKEEKDVGEAKLREMASDVEGFFEEVDIRV